MTPSKRLHTLTKDCGVDSKDSGAAFSRLTCTLLFVLYSLEGSESSLLVYSNTDYKELFLYIHNA